MSGSNSSNRRQIPPNTEFKISRVEYADGDFDLHSVFSDIVRESLVRVLSNKNAIRERKEGCSE